MPDLIASAICCFSLDASLKLAVVSSGTDGFVGTLVEGGEVVASVGAVRTGFGGAISTTTDCVFDTESLGVTEEGAIVADGGGALTTDGCGCTEGFRDVSSIDAATDCLRFLYTSVVKFSASGTSG